MRFAIGAISHHTNTFSLLPTTLRDFELHELIEGSDILSRYRGTGTPIGGAIDAARGKATLVPTIATFAASSGVVTAETTDALVERLCGTLAEHQSSLDGVWLQLNGALVSERDSDGASFILRRVRALLGTAIPIAVVVESHANLTRELVDLADFVVGCDTYQHLDAPELGARALDLLVALIERRVRPRRALRSLPILVPLNAQWTGREPMRSLLEQARDLERRPGVLNVTVAPGFPFSDVPFAGFSICVTTDDDPALANEMADRLAAAVWEKRRELVVPGINLEEAIHQAMAAPGGPVVLADQGDNPGASGAGDGTALLWGLLDLGARDAALALIADPAAVEQARAAGIGATVNLTLGGKRDTRAGYPIDVRAKVERVTDGTVTLEGPLWRGRRLDLGPLAVLRAEGRHGGSVAVVVTSRAAEAHDLAFFHAAGIEPASKRILAVKSSVHFWAAFEPIASEVIEVATPGITTTDLRFFDFKRLRRPIFPLDPFDVDQPEPMWSS